MKNSGLPADLPDAARLYLDAFPKGEIVAFPIDPIDRVGIPVWIVALFPEDQPRLDGVMPYGVGYGMDEGQAILGAMGEIAEMAFPALSLGAREKTRGSYAELAASVGERSVADPLTLCLPAGSSVGRDTQLEWVEGVRHTDGSTVLVPIDLAAYNSAELSEGYKPFTTIISNGMGAGPDLDWAVGHGLCEILQRDGNGLLFRALDRGVAIDLPDDLPEGAAALLANYEAAGVRPIPKFATDEFGICNLYCVGVDERGAPAEPIMVSACGEAAHPDRNAALEKVLTEYAASRARKAYAHGDDARTRALSPETYVDRFLARSGGAAKSSDRRALGAMIDWQLREAGEIRGWLSGNMLSEKHRKPFADLPHSACPGPRDRGRIALERAVDAGFDPLYVDMTPAGCPVATVKLIVPGMEVETMSYYRIGERGTRKLIEMDSELITFGKRREGLEPVRVTPEAIDRFGGQPLFDTKRAAEIVGPLYPLYREPEAHHAASHRVAA
ncbi:YcaO-like family protein [Qipengyuania atrilutea]|uniref:YcaO-like family protein n=1 Tax=Qipengyuania atrilutea TaxID=2744473 RepID=A0A850H3S4_9SPHN|nr:YcaO-like family protein [Actirhodobacter atriluteus]NVD45296.1 YcaO-like family protein [Actirhodobacter atriluteus]